MARQSGCRDGAEGVLGSVTAGKAHCFAALSEAVYSSTEYQADAGAFTASRAWDMLGAVFASLLDEMQLTEAGIGLEVSYSGNTGPRCAGSDCLPLPYGQAAQRLEERRQERLEHGTFALPYDPALPRRMLEHSGALSLGGACLHDGECGPAG